MRRSPELKRIEKETRMHLTKRLGLASAIFFGVLFVSACPQQETISKINADPGRYRNKEVGIAGTVTDSYGVLGNGAYEIDDGTGRIWVVTMRGVPSRGSRVGAKGKIYTGLSWGGRSFGTVLQETDRKAKGR
jgi:DNA/RNA endonuclease YhcR with UshA esterase domain